MKKESADDFRKLRKITRSWANVTRFCSGVRRQHYNYYYNL